MTWLFSKLFRWHYAEKKAFFVYFWLLLHQPVLQNKLHCKNRRSLFALPAITGHTCANTEKQDTKDLKNICSEQY